MPLSHSLTPSASQPAQTNTGQQQDTERNKHRPKASDIVQRVHPPNSCCAILLLHQYQRSVRDEISRPVRFGQSTTISVKLVLIKELVDIPREPLTRVGRAELAHSSSAAAVAAAVSVVEAARMSRHSQSLSDLSDGVPVSKERGTSISVAYHSRSVQGASETSRIHTCRCIGRCSSNSS